VAINKEVAMPTEVVVVTPTRVTMHPEVVITMLQEVVVKTTTGHHNNNPLKVRVGSHLMGSLSVTFVAYLVIFKRTVEN
jgi:hypothetical protein